MFVIRKKSIKFIFIRLRNSSIQTIFSTELKQMRVAILQDIYVRQFLSYKKYK